MANFKVVWEIDIDADSPFEAAEEAWFTMRAEGSTANCFIVEDSTGYKTPVDLEHDS